MDVQDAVALVQAALSDATREMPAKEYLEVLDELIDDFETRHSVAIEETGD
jgi:hypothetical protein